MDDLRGRVHEAAAAPSGTVDPIDLASRAARRGRRRRVQLVGGGSAAVALIVTTAIAVSASGGPHGHVETREPPTSSSTESTFPGTGVTTPLSDKPTKPTASVGDTTAVSQTTSPTSAPGSDVAWNIGPTTGLGHDSEITITATGNLADGQYWAQQCAAAAVPTLPITGDPVAEDLPGCFATQLAIYASAGRLGVTGSGFSSWYVPAVGYEPSIISSDFKLGGGPTTDCSAAPGACALVIGKVADPSWTLHVVPLTFDPARRPTLSVTPTDALHDGQSVTLHGSGWGYFALAVYECVDRGEVFSGPPCVEVGSVATSHADTFDATFPVAGSILETPTSSIDCAVASCVLVVTDDWSPVQPGARFPLHFTATG